MSYEQFRSSFAARLMDHHLPPEIAHDILQELDLVSAGYEIRRACTDLITTESFPEIVRVYCASLAVENKSMKTIKDYKMVLSAFFDAVRKPYNTVTTNDIRVYMFTRQSERKLKKSTVEHIRVVINAFYFVT